MEIRSIQQNYPNPNFRGIVKLNGDPAFLKEFAERFKSSTFFESGKQCGRPNDIINVNWVLVQYYFSIHNYYFFHDFIVMVM